MSLNKHAKRSFIMGHQISFGEDGIASKSRYNPVCQYNSSKQDKYQIDSFVLVNAGAGKHFILNIKVHQEKNTANVHVVEEAWMLPTMQKAVVNALVSCGIVNDLVG